jgi:hypothetical protein
MTRARDVADTQDNLGGAVAPFVAGKNGAFNSGMDLAQRGTSISYSASSPAYSLDRWYINNGASQALTVARVATSDTTNLPNIQYAMRVQRNSGQTGTGTISLSQSLETVNSIPFVGKTITFSFYARAGANYSQTSNALGAYIYTGTGTDQNVVTAYTGAAIPLAVATTLTTTWQRFQGSGTIATSATELAISFQFTPTGTASTNDYFEITGVQLELGSVATPFARAGGSIGGELALCQRYFERIKPDGNNMALPAFANSSTVAYVNLIYKVTKRNNPTITLGTGAGDFAVRVQGDANQTMSAFSVIGNNQNNAWLSATASGLTAGNGCFMVNTNQNSFLDASSEL